MLRAAKMKSALIVLTLITGLLASQEGKFNSCEQISFKTKLLFKLSECWQQKIRDNINGIKTQFRVSTRVSLAISPAVYEN